MLDLREKFYSLWENAEDVFGMQEERMTEGDSRLQHGMDSNILKQRAKHDPLSVENVRNGSRTIAARVVVVPARRIIEQLEEDGLWGAYKSITRALEIETSGLGMKMQNMESTGKGYGRTDDGLLFMKYIRWIDLCRERLCATTSKQRKAPLMVRNMILDGWTFERIEVEYKLKHGTAKEKLWEFLALWSEV